MSKWRNALKRQSARAKLGRHRNRVWGSYAGNFKNLLCKFMAQSQLFWTFYEYNAQGQVYEIVVECGTLCRRTKHFYRVGSNKDSRTFSGSLPASGGVFPTGVFPTGVLPTGVFPTGVLPTAGGDSPTSRLRLHSVLFYSFINAVISFIEYAFTLLCRTCLLGST